MSSELFKVKNAYDEAILQLEEVRRFFEKRKNGMSSFSGRIRC